MSFLFTIYVGMKSVPGRPCEPTVHQSRTRPEAVDFAVKNRSTNDWFRHDATTMKVPLVAGTCPKLQSTGDWLATAGEGAPAVHRRCPSQQAQAVCEKIQGRQEAWFKHDDNRHYVDPVQADRGTEVSKVISNCGI
jgi:hypothetical protein